MKELTIEEKAKAYDEALERARIWKDKSGMPKDKQGILDDIFPELQVSGDERIRREMIKGISKTRPNTPFLDTNITREEALAWLEKQDKQNPCESCEEARLNCQNFPCERKKNFDSANKVKPKFKVGDIIKPKDGGHEPWQIMQVDMLDKKYRFKDGCVIHFSQEDDYELIEQKPAGWSEEDEVQMNAAIDICKNLGYTPTSDWLKSLKGRITWKPTEPQLVSLTIACGRNDRIGFELRQLLQELKKL